MITDADALREFEDSLVTRDSADYLANLRIFEALWNHATQLGVLPLEDPLDGLEVDLRLAEALNVC
ncbi:MAG: hypothetical protein LJE93_14260 [Acidobacteria bacterium]|jgi:hypothetical protein|nr:hypothetical protein [Acidobacteriota bacterium]